VTDEELAGLPGGVATRPEGEPEAHAAEPVFSPKDFRLNLGARLAVADEEPLPPVGLRLSVADEEPLPTVASRRGTADDELLPNLDNPAIRKLTWEHVVSDRPASSAPSAATTVPLPPPRRVPPPPPQPVAMFQPPTPTAPPETVVVAEELVDEVVVEDEVVLDEPDIIGDDLEEDAVDGHVDDDIEPAIEDVTEPSIAHVQPEVNRLASVPDLIDDDSPVELPAITPSGPMVVHEQIVYMPVLAETPYVPPSARPLTTVAPAAAPVKAKGRKSSRKPKRHLFRTFMTLVLLFGLLAGGAYAAKKYLLHPPQWTVEMKPLADEVAAARGLQFKVAVAVTPLPPAQYASRLAAATVDTSADTAPTWRALGLLSGELDLEAVGRQALNDAPAFYDPTTKTILISDDLQTYDHLYRFALRRAMTAALLDQQFDWSSRMATASPTAALAIRATIDGDALAVANALAVNDAPDQLAPEQLAFVQGHANAVSPSQYAATIAGRVGAALRPKIAPLLSAPVALAAMEQATPSSDAVLDAGRLPTTIASPAGTQGMMFWYYVLASRIDDGQAWSAAVRWSGDSVTTSMGSVSQCVDAKIVATDVDGAAALLAAFQSWAALAPAESTTTVTPIDANQVAIRACDPGATVSAQIPAKVPVVFGGAAVERALVEAAFSAAGTAKVDAACLVNAARQRGTVLTSPADDSPVLAIGWQPAYVAANLDLATACVAPA
jgi:hypothetical protein